MTDGLLKPINTEAHINRKYGGVLLLDIGEGLVLHTSGNLLTSGASPSIHTSTTAIGGLFDVKSAFRHFFLNYKQLKNNSQNPEIYDSEPGFKVRPGVRVELFWMLVTTAKDDGSTHGGFTTFNRILICTVTHLVDPSGLEISCSELINQYELAILMNSLVNF